MGRWLRVLALTLAVMLVGVSQKAAAEPPSATLWNVTFDISPVDQPFAIAVGPDGNPVVAGMSLLGAQSDVRTIKYAGTTGAVLWNVTFDSGSEDAATGVAVGPDGNPVVTGVSGVGANADFRTIKYAGATGVELWNVTFDSGNEDTASGVAVGPDGNPVVVGYSWNGSDYDFRIIKYAGATGAELWNVTFNSGFDDRAFGVAVSGSGDPAVTGDSFTGTDSVFRTMKLDGANGAVLWNVIFNGPFDDSGAAVAVGSDNNPVATGSAGNGVDNDFRTIKYDGATGAELWNVTFDGGGQDDGTGVAVGPDGNPVTVGLFVSASGLHDFHAIKYDGATGAALWNAIFDSGDLDDAHAVAVGPDGNPVVAGVTISAGGDYDFRVIKFLAQPNVVIDVKPGSYPNSIKLADTGGIPVAIFSTVDFDATTIDPATLLLNSAPVRLVNGKGLMASFEDKNNDGILDLMVHFDRGLMDLMVGDGMATMTGETFTGDPVLGTDSVRVIE